MKKHISCTYFAKHVFKMTQTVNKFVSYRNFFLEYSPCKTPVCVSYRSLARSKFYLFVFLVCPKEINLLVTGFLHFGKMKSNLFVISSSFNFTTLYQLKDYDVLTGPRRALA